MFVPPRRAVRPARARGNALWRRWRAPGICLGLGTLFFGLLITLMEIGRAFTGTDNRGCLDNNVKIWNYYQSDPQLAPISSANVHNVLPKETQIFWPWARPGTLFGLVMIATGVVGIISGLRRSYSSMIAFLIMSLLSFFLTIYLIAYYSVAVHFYNYRNTCMFPGQNRTGNQFKNFLGLTRALLAFCIFAILWFVLSCLLSCVATSAYKRKGQFRQGIPRGAYPPRMMPPPRFIR